MKLRKLLNIKFFKTDNDTQSFQQFEIIRPLAQNIFSDKDTLSEENEDQSHLFVEIMNLQQKIRPRNLGKQPKIYIILKDSLKSSYAFFDGKKCF